MLTTTETQDGTMVRVRLGGSGSGSGSAGDGEAQGSVSGSRHDGLEAWLVVLLRLPSTDVFVLGASPRMAERLIGEVWGTLTFLSAAEQLLRPRVAAMKPGKPLPLHVPDLTVLRRMGSGEAQLQGASCEHATATDIDAFRALIAHRVSGMGAGDTAQRWLPPACLDPAGLDHLSGTKCLPLLPLVCSGAAVGFRLGPVLATGGGAALPRPSNTSHAVRFTLLDACMITAFSAPRLPHASVASILIPADGTEDGADGASHVNATGLGLPFLNAKLFGGGRLIAAVTRDGVRWLGDCMRKAMHSLDSSNHTKHGRSAPPGGRQGSASGSAVSGELNRALSRTQAPRARSGEVPYAPGFGMNRRGHEDDNLRAAASDRALSFSSHGTGSTARDSLQLDAAGATADARGPDASRRQVR